MHPLQEDYHLIIYFSTMRLITYQLYTRNQWNAKLKILIFCISARYRIVAVDEYQILSKYPIHVAIKVGYSVLVEDKERWRYLYGLRCIISFGQIINNEYVPMSFFVHFTLKMSLSKVSPQDRLVIISFFTQ